MMSPPNGYSSADEALSYATPEQTASIQVTNHAWLHHKIYLDHSKGYHIMDSLSCSSRFQYAGVQTFASVIPSVCILQGMFISFVIWCEAVWGKCICVCHEGQRMSMCVCWMAGIWHRATMQMHGLTGLSGCLFAGCSSKAGTGTRP